MTNSFYGQISLMEEPTANVRMNNRDEVKYFFRINSFKINMPQRIISWDLDGGSDRGSAA